MKEYLRELVSKSKFEDVILIEKIEDILKDKRGYIFHMPRPGSPVVIGMSGGADSTIVTALLMEEFNLSVYPFFIKRGAKAEKFEEASVDFFAKYFKKHYPKLFHEPIKIKVSIPAKELKNDFPPETRKGFGYPLRNSIILAYGVEYAVSLLSCKQIKVRTVFESIIASDADQTVHSTLTTLRSLMLHVCIDVGDWEWQLTSFPLETELNNYYAKNVLAKKAKKLSLPLERTRSCLRPSKMHCGICTSCFDRKRSVDEKVIKDKTAYINRVSTRELKREDLDL